MPKKRRTAKKAALGNQRIESYDPTTPLGKVRSLGDLNDIPVSKTMMKKVSAKVNLKKKVEKNQAKKRKSAAKKKARKYQRSIADIFSMKPKPKPGAS